MVSPYQLIVCTIIMEELMNSNFSTEIMLECIYSKWLFPITGKKILQMVNVIVGSNVNLKSSKFFQFYFFYSCVYKLTLLFRLELHRLCNFCCWWEALRHTNCKWKNVWIDPMAPPNSPNFLVRPGSDSRMY